MKKFYDNLQEFFKAWQEQRTKETKNTLPENIAQFLHQFSAYYQEEAQTASDAPPSPKIIDVQILSEFLASLEKPLETSRHSAIDFSPWRVIGLGRDEVRVVSILSWLFDPRGSHGFGSSLQLGLLAHVNLHIPQFPTATGKRCQVRTEVNPNGETGNRVDIEIDSENFYLIIEAKIESLEQPKQLERYCDQAKMCTKQHSRPWAIIYLTPDGRKASHEEANIVCLSWYQLSIILHECIKRHQTGRGNSPPPIQHNADFFAKTYANHIRSF